VLFAQGETVIGLSQGGQWLTVWAIRLCLVAYVWAMALTVYPGSVRLSRALWTIGCGMCLIHIGLAMHFYHHWSHAAALVDTARQTREAVGLDWGGGIYFNYLFAAVWLGDVLWWWIWPASRAVRSRWISVLLHAYLAFIVFNATIVFEAGPMRWTAVAACAGLMLIWIRARYRGALRNRKPVDGSSG
jgi:hypothetical protein